MSITNKINLFSFGCVTESTNLWWLQAHQQTLPASHLVGIYSSTFAWVGPLLPLLDKLSGKIEKINLAAPDVRLNKPTMDANQIFLVTSLVASHTKENTVRGQN